MSKTRHDYECEFENLMDSALSELSPEAFRGFIDSVTMILSDYEDNEDE